MKHWTERWRTKSNPVWDVATSLACFAAVLLVDIAAIRVGAGFVVVATLLVSGVDLHVIRTLQRRLKDDA